MNWYDWNPEHADFLEQLAEGRDWSAWIDTIETICRQLIVNNAKSASGLICMNWYDWNSPLSALQVFEEPTSSGLICMNWYDWNFSEHDIGIDLVAEVGIDLHELIRLKHHAYPGKPCTGRIQVGIDLHELIRLKLLYHKNNSMLLTASGLICMNWYDWNACKYTHMSFNKT